MKALEFLYALEIDAKTDILISEAITELEELMKPKTCESCKYNKEIDNFMVFCEAKNIDGFICGWHGNTKDYCCNRYEPKDD